MALEEFEKKFFSFFIEGIKKKSLKQDDVRFLCELPLGHFI